METHTAGERNETLNGPMLVLAREPDRTTVDRVWRALTSDERASAAEAFARDDEDFLQFMQERVARGLHFRRQTIETWPIGRTASAFAARRIRSPEILGSLLRRLHLEFRRSMMGAFLDALGVEHEDGEAEEIEQLAAAATPERVALAADAIASDHPLLDVIVYLSTLVALGTLPVEAVSPWLRDAAEGARGVDPQAEDEPLEDDEPDARPAPEDTDEFTTLDRQLVHAIISAAEGIEGSLASEEIDDLVHEVGQLNSSRHRTYFHHGLRDILFAGKPAFDMKAANPQRLRWYWSGVVQGLAREQRWREAVELYDSEGTVRSLGDSGEGPSDAAAWWVVRALAERGRSAEIPDFLTVQALVSSPRLFLRLHQHASSLLREDRAAEARGSLGLLARAIERFEEQGLDASSPLFLEVRRRRAHCFRQLGELEQARRILQQLLDEESDPEVITRVLADIGLIDGDFRRLSDVRLPREQDRLADLQQRLERGRTWYERAAAHPSDSSAHGRYCLGVLAMTHQRWMEARDHIEHAYSVFAQSPDRYGKDDLLAQTRMYLGVAICQALDVERMSTAARHLTGAAEAGVVPPKWLILQTLEALSLKDQQLQAQTAEVFVSGGGDRALDAVVESEGTLASAGVRQALLRRARSGERSSAARADDYLVLLPHALSAGELERAIEALDFLENVAERGTRTNTVLEILSDPGSYEPAWDADAAFEARVRLLEASQRYPEAAEIMGDEIHRLLSRGGEVDVEEAEGLFERLLGYGLPADAFESLRGRLQNVRGDDAIDDEPTPSKHLRPVRVLFVGGDERQERHQHAIREALRESAPHIEVRFIHPGWGSNWSRYVEEVERALPDTDGVVLMRFMRTEFGRSVRRLLDVPWRHCFGPGRKTMIRSISGVARAVEEGWR